MSRILTLTTDFGLADPYVGIMKGVILSIAPDVLLVDLTHAVPSQEILAGALAMEAAVPYFPADTVHLAVVDPGVGSARAAIAVETDAGTFVGPDNGLFTAVLARNPARRAVRLTNPAYHRHPVSATFHGRDIFAPAAAHIAAGADLAAMGEPAPEIARLDLPNPVPKDGGWEAHVVHADHFGNLVTDFTAAMLPQGANLSAARLILAGEPIHGIARIYTDVEPGKLVAYFGSSGRLEIAIRNGSAAETLGLAPGALVQIRDLR